MNVFRAALCHHAKGSEARLAGMFATVAAAAVFLTLLCHFHWPAFSWPLAAQLSLARSAAGGGSGVRLAPALGQTWLCRNSKCLDGDLSLVRRHCQLGNHAAVGLG